MIQSKILHANPCSYLVRTAEPLPPRRARAEAASRRRNSSFPTRSRWQGTRSRPVVTSNSNKFVELSQRAVTAGRKRCTSSARFSMANLESTPRESGGMQFQRHNHRRLRNFNFSSLSVSMTSTCPAAASATSLSAAKAKTTTSSRGRWHRAHRVKLNFSTLRKVVPTVRPNPPCTRTSSRSKIVCSPKTTQDIPSLQPDEWNVLSIFEPFP